MDWSLCEAIASTHFGAIRLLLHIYDINCQYWKYLRERIERNFMLDIEEHIELLHAIGLFHVHGHKDECLYRWATSYVPGAGIVDGEVLETLWSVLNTVSAATRTASLAHRTEILDDHMNDSNWKKMQNIGKSHPTHQRPTMKKKTVKTVIGRYQRAVENLAEARQAFKTLTDAAPADSVDIWSATIAEAEELRTQSPEAMDIMHSRIKTRQSVKAIRAALAEEDTQAPDLGADGNATTDWLLEGLHIEDEQ